MKSSTEADKAVYAADVAFQKYVLESCGVKVTGTYLICIDNRIVCRMEASRPAVCDAGDKTSVLSVFKAGSPDICSNIFLCGVFSVKDVRLLLFYFSVS